MKTLLIRPYHPDDRGVIRNICLKTAFRNRGHDLFFEDGDVFADYWVDGYLLSEPDLCFVAEKEKKVVGYLLGCSDSIRMLKIMKKKIFPKVAFKLIKRLITFQYRNSLSYRTLRWALFKSWKEVPPVPRDRFPAHYHSNISRDGIRMLGYSSLLLRFLDELEKKGIPGLYGILLEPKSGGIFSKLFSKMNSLGYKEEFYSECPTAMYKDVLGDPTPMVNRVYASSLEMYRPFVLYIRKRYNI